MKTISKWPNFRLAVASLLVSTIVLSQHVVADQQCTATNLTEVFNNPGRYGNHTFCGEAFIYKRSGLYGFFDRVIDDKHPNSPEGPMLLPVAPGLTDMQVHQLESGTRVTIMGKLEPKMECFTGELFCTPIRRPIFIRGLVLRESP
jgi:hypothetical protein